MRSALLDMPGVGPAREKALLRSFGSLKALKVATVDEIARVPGIGQRLATEIASRLRDKKAPSE